MKDKPTKPNGTLSTDNPNFGCWQSREVYWDMVNGDVWVFEPPKLLTDGDVWLTSWDIDDWKSEGYDFKPLLSEAVKEVKPQGNTPFKWPDYWPYSMDDNVTTTETLDPFERGIQEDLRSKKGDNVKHPNHYNQDGQIECIDAIKASLGLEGFAAYCKGNVEKYVWRYKYKGGLEDLKKSQQYLTWLIETEEEIQQCSSQ